MWCSIGDRSGEVYLGEVDAGVENGMVGRSGGRWRGDRRMENGIGEEGRYDCYGMMRA